MPARCVDTFLSVSPYARDVSHPTYHRRIETRCRQKRRDSIDQWQLTSANVDELVEFDADQLAEQARFCTVSEVRHASSKARTSAQLTAGQHAEKARAEEKEVGRVRRVEQGRYAVGHGEHRKEAVQ